MSSPKFISIFNNKGGVGKTSLTWNIADAIAETGKRVLLIDFDPQCNLSIAMLGGSSFKSIVVNVSSGQTVRGFLQGYLQNQGPGEPITHNGPNTNPRVDLIAGDFWLNVYSDALSVGNDILAGNGLSKFTAIRMIVHKLSDKGKEYDYVMIDLPPSFGGIVRSAIYSSDYIMLPCTSDTFSEYCISLISQMLPQFVSDWEIGLARFKQNNYASGEFDHLGKPKYAGWFFNGYDTRSGKMLRADKAHFEKIAEANVSLVQRLKSEITSYDPIIEIGVDRFNIGGVEDMNILAQNSLWQNVPAQKLDHFLQVKNLTGDKQKWSASQLTLIGEVRKQINSIADRIVSTI